MQSPLEQFIVYPVGLIPLLPAAGKLPFFLLSNFTYFLGLVISLLFCSLFLLVSFYRYPLVLSSRFICLRFFRFLTQLIQENIPNYGFLFFSYLFLLFLFIFLANCFGMVPYSFAITSHLIVTLFLSSLSFVIALFVGLKTHGVRFFALFLPAGAPLFLAPFLVGIELISYGARLFSLAIRLFANVMAGHTLLKILASFSWLLLVQGAVLTSFLPFSIILLVTGLELVIAILQAYVFAVLTMIYFNEALVLH